MSTNIISIILCSVTILSCNIFPSGESTFTSKTMIGGGERGHVIEPIDRAEINDFAPNRSRFDFLESK